MSKSYYQRREDELKVLIARAKIRNNLTDKKLANKIGVPYSTFGKQKGRADQMQLKHILIRTDPDRVTKPMWATRLLDRLMPVITAGAAVGMFGILVAVATRGL